MDISTREGIDSTASEVISQEFTIGTLEESDHRIDLRGNIRTVGIIDRLCEESIEASSSLLEIEDDIFSVVNHKRNRELL